MEMRRDWDHPGTFGAAPTQGSATLNVSWLQFAYWKHLSKPAQDRALYRRIDRGDVTSITEIGIGKGIRTDRMLAFALRHKAPSQIRYAGLDSFEARSADRPGLTLKDAYRKWNSLGIQVRLVPGDVLSGILRSANSLPKTDLIVISAEVDANALEPAWFYFPRMLHEKSVVMLESGNVRHEFHTLNFQQVNELAKKEASVVRRAA